MASSPPTDTEEATARRPRPLTRTTTEGRTLVRRAEVEAEITAALTQDPKAWVAMAKRTEGMCSETMVHLVRHLAARADQSRVMGELLLVLDARVCSIARRFARGFDETTTEEIALEVAQSLMELMLGQDRERGDFLEVSFRGAVKGRVIDAADKRRRVAKPYEVLAAKAKRKNPKRYEIVEEAFGIDDTHASDPQKRLLAAESEAMGPELIKKAIDRVKNPKHREAVILHHLRGWPITDQDRDADCLCHHFGVGDRQIREWIATAFAQMRRAIGETS
jgi:hypothetical protein